MPLIDADNQLRGVVAFVYVRDSAVRLQPEAGRLDTIADLAAQTVERSLLYQHEHELVVNLQRQTLVELPHVEGLQIAASYVPASRRSAWAATGTTSTSSTTAGSAWWWAMSPVTESMRSPT